MGGLIKAICECGFESDDLPIGSGMMDYKEGVCGVPNYCDNCKIIGVAIIKDQISKSSSNAETENKITCRQCGREAHYYGEIVKGKIEYKADNIADWPVTNDKVWVLKNKFYYCPKCQKNRIKFYFSGYWD
jgi:hypothetical protein